ncbi:Uncharacterised nucleotidyltransferase [Paenibacillus sp. UNC496MF]|uniref:nucleotidyltransferase domain-containing protein n=1 Tax=Paenibacillus sp. UNC496MF TaxID=1502753 RepID=UPI0008F2C3DA|nr:nucleotidyltransferase family protein [Paenibacillus sp. UNC496MF]SFI88701.1 Uncharacterised nucleotidyltransferase [Paenibacillus sp. UNC496MF]
MLIDFLQNMYDESDMTCSEPEGLWEEIEYYSVAPQVYHLLRARGGLDGLQEELRAKLKEAADAVLFHNMFVRSEMNKLLALFEREGIAVIPLKGTIFAERYFGHFAARGTSDIDLLIAPAELAKASGLLRGMGYEQQGAADKTHFHVLFNKTFPTGNFGFIGVELHWGVLRTHVSSTDIDQLWRDSAPYGVYQHVRELRPEAVFYHICLHGYHHQLLGFKYILDVAHLLFAIGGQIDYDELFAQAKRDGNLAKVRIVLTHVYGLFPALEHLKPLPKRKRWPFWGMGLVRDAVVGAKGWRYYAFRIAASFVTFDSWKQSVSDIRYSWFPTKEFAQYEELQLRESDSTFKLYLKLYAKRFQRIRNSQQPKAK